MDRVEIKINADVSKIENAAEKVNELYKKIQEVKTLANEVSSCIADLHLEINI